MLLQQANTYPTVHSLARNFATSKELSAYRDY